MNPHPTPSAETTTLSRGRGTRSTHRKGVQTKFVRKTVNPARQKTRSNQQGPEVLHIVVSLVVIHLILGTEAEPESRVLQKFLAAPGWNIKQAGPFGTYRPKAVSQNGNRVPQMFQNRDAKYDVQTGRRHLLKDIGQCSFDRGYFTQGF